MSDDELARRIVVEARNDADRRALAAAFGEADVIARHLPVGAVPALSRAAWVSLCALLAESHAEPTAPALRAAATALLLEACEVMEPIITVPSPLDARELDA